MYKIESLLGNFQMFSTVREMIKQEQCCTAGIHRPVVRIGSDSGPFAIKTTLYNPQKNHTKESLIAARDELCEISSHFAAVRSGPFATDDPPRKCLREAGGKCYKGGLCKVGCGEGGYCCSRFLIESNRNCPAGRSLPL